MLTSLNGLTTTDLFCGAGGSGIGAHAAGIKLEMAANHWAKAIETHAANFPDTAHDCADISQVNPRRYPTTDLLWASPECTNFSPAKIHTVRPEDARPDQFGETLPGDAVERSRATMWDVPRFAEQHRYQAILVENVVEASRWVMFPAWLQAMTLLGYEHQIVSLNSMHAPAEKAPRAPQSRDRMYVVFHRKGNKRPDVTPAPLGYCDSCGTTVRGIQTWKNGRTVGRYRAQYVYRCPKGHQVEPFTLPAAAAIDWSLAGQRIGDRKKPLAPKTMARIQAGLDKFGTVEARRLALAANRHNLALMTQGNTALALPSEAEPDWSAFVAEMRGMTSSHNKALRSVSQPLATFTAGGRHHMLIRNNGEGGGAPGWQCTHVDEPARTITTKGHQSLVSITRPIDDATYRMLEPHEIKAAMAFGRDYRVLGTRAEQIRQLGNGVTPPASEFLYRAVAASLN